MYHNKNAQEANNRHLNSLHNLAKLSDLYKCIIRLYMYVDCIYIAAAFAIIDVLIAHRIEERSKIKSLNKQTD